MAAGLLLLAALAPVATVSDWGTLVAEGERWWTRSPSADQPVACATCHHDPAATRGWAASFPKLRPLPPPHTRVMTLLQASAEAVARHYRLADPRPVATAITAFLTARDAGRPITPGVTPDQPVFPERLLALAQSVARGRRLFAERCHACHQADGVAPGAGGFRPGAAAPLEVFLETHGPPRHSIPWNSGAMADLLAYLLGHRTGQVVTAGGARGAEEGSP